MEPVNFKGRPACVLKHPMFPLDHYMNAAKTKATCVFIFLEAFGLESLDNLHHREDASVSVFSPCIVTPYNNRLCQWWFAVA